jgi:hypothetical protein
MAKAVGESIGPGWRGRKYGRARIEEGGAGYRAMFWMIDFWVTGLFK